MIESTNWITWAIIRILEYYINSELGHSPEVAAIVMTHIMVMSTVS